MLRFVTTQKGEETAVTPIIAAVALLLWPVSTLAQSWSQAQLQIIDQTRRCNDGWSRSVEAKDFDLFADACPQADGAVYWYTNTPTPVAYAADKDVWPNAAASGNRVEWGSFEPNTVLVTGDTALIYYSIVWTIIAPDGGIVRAPSRRLSVFERRDGSWLMAGGQISNVAD
jgi:ketosteroid isomerase-like protein